MNPSCEIVLPDDRRCPLCERPNGCMQAGTRRAPIDPGGPPAVESACWCRDATFDAALLQRAVRIGGGLRCLCARCAASVPPGPAPAPAVSGRKRSR